jgi:hypothetical protein
MGYQRLSAHAADVLLSHWLENPHSVQVREFSEALADKFTRRTKQIGPEQEVWDLYLSYAEKFLSKLSLSLPNGRSAPTTIARLENPAWWRKQLFRSLTRHIDQLARLHGSVHQRREIYLSDEALLRYLRRAADNEDFLSSMEAVSSEGNKVPLSELADHSLSKAENRRAEYMVRSRGIEERAADLGYVPLFVTFTSPSKHHCRHFSGQPNTKWVGSTPKQVQHDYFGKSWAQIRAALARNQIAYLGVRIVEPHHDGTPHWHMLLYVVPTLKELLISIIKSKALEEDGNEPGAQQKRVEIVEIDPTKGSATGYVAKYITKSVDGHAIDTDTYGNPAVDSAQRIVAWSRVWGIRQFQTFGTPPIGVYRELRRLRTPTTPLYESTRVAADAAEYRDVIRLSEELGLVTFRAPWIDEKSGECSSPINGYGEELLDPVRGIQAESVPESAPLTTRDDRWTIQRVDDV